MNTRLIAGLGNPGTKYAATRHNLGFEVVRVFAKRKGFSFKKGFRIKAEIAEVQEGEIGTETKSICLLPMTYMNRSGLAIRKGLGRYRVPFANPEAFLVVVDDANIPFGSMRLRPVGSSGGHNGLKSIEECLGSSNYARLRIGVGGAQNLNMPLEDYVLAEFSPEEQKNLSKICQRGADVIECWIHQGLEKAMQMAGETKNAKE